MKTVPIEGYDGLYTISENGTITGLQRFEEVPPGRHPTSWVRKRQGLVKKVYAGKRGYCYVSLFKDGKLKMSLLHRLLAKAFIPNPLELPEVNHVDGNPSNNSLGNLEWCTRSENALHSTRVLNKNRGESSGTSKLTEEDVLAIKILLQEKVLQTTIAEMFNFSNHCIFRIAHGYNWSRLTGFGKEGT